MNTKSIGRNDPCPCGSGKKYKQCCQNKENNNSEAAKNRLLESIPDLFKQAQIALQQGKLQEAEHIYLHILSFAPKQVETLNNLASVYQQMGQKDKSISALKKACHIAPSYQMYYNLAHLSGNSLEGIDYLRKAINLNPGDALSYNLLGAYLLDQNKATEAILAFNKSLSINPKLSPTLNNLANALLYQGDYDQARQYYKQAVINDPNNDSYLKSLLFSMTYDEQTFFKHYLTEAKHLNNLWKKNAIPHKQWRCYENTTPLRIGFISGDLGYHPVGYFIEGLLSHLDKTQIECFVYHTRHPSDEDDISKRLANYCQNWRNIHFLSDQQAAQQIHDDGIHILFDLSGYTVNTGLSIFAWCPAPIQISWLGYFASTGLDFMDYFIADPISITEYNKSSFTEKIVYLPHTRLCYTAPDDINIEPLSAPVSKNKYITFGCFQQLSKINDHVLTTWSKILENTPNSRLIIKNKKFNDEGVKYNFLKRLSSFSINPKQIFLEGSSPRVEYFESYNRVDFMLDTFPYTGGTTTCEALFMGVPTLTLTGETLLQRQGQSMLTNAQLEDWVCSSPEEYIHKAIDFANHPLLLEKLRTTLREQALKSPLMDIKRFSKDFSKLLFEIWNNHPHKNSTT